MKYQKRNPSLKYRETKYNQGDVDFDPKSPQPSFVDYNGVRESIRQAKLAGEDHPKFNKKLMKQGKDFSDMMDKMSKLFGDE